MGTATVAMILNGLGFSNRQLYLVPHYFENKPVKHALGEGITADLLNDNCLRRTLDWLYTHDVTTLFAGLAYQARRRFGITAQHIHIVLRKWRPYAQRRGLRSQWPSPMAIRVITERTSNSGCLTLATTYDRDLPIFLKPLDGNSSDKEHLSSAVKAVMVQLREQVPEELEPRIATFDSGGYSEANMKSYNDAKID